MLRTLLVAVLVGHISTQHIMKQRVVANHSRIWSRGEIPYRLSYEIDEKGPLATTIAAALAEIESVVNVQSSVKPCLRFWKSPTTESVDSYLFFHIAKDGVCGTPSVGRTAGRNFVFLGESCEHESGIMTLVLVSLGMFYEHGRPDRDTYIQVHMDNVVQDYRSFYEKVNASEINTMGLPYDFESLTHFGPYTHANNSLVPAITSNWTSASFGNMDRMSSTDVRKIQFAYQCVDDTTALIQKYRDDVRCTFEHETCPLTHYLIYSHRPPYNQLRGQWGLRTRGLPHGGPSGDNSNGRGTYMATIQNDARMYTSQYLSPGTYCVHLHYCISTSAASTSAASTSSLVRLGTDVGTIAEGHYVSKAWTPLNATHVSSTQWRLWIYSVHRGDDTLAIDDVYVTSSPCLSV